MTLDTLLVCLAVYFYFFPTLYSWKYFPDSWLSAALFNLFFGWTVVGWWGEIFWVMRRVSVGRREDARKRSRMDEAEKRCDKLRDRELALNPRTIKVFLEQLDQLPMETPEHDAFWERIERLGDEDMAYINEKAAAYFAYVQASDAYFGR